jgi:hypothetical protein
MKMVSKVSHNISKYWCLTFASGLHGWESYLLEHVEEEFENHMEDLIEPSYEIGDNATCGIAIMFFGGMPILTTRFLLQHKCI